MFVVGVRRAWLMIGAYAGARTVEVAVAEHPVVGYLVWGVLFGAIFAWEGIGLVRLGDGFPTLSDAMGAVMRYPVGRWALFALWLWFGWHFFVRGWHFLLQDAPR